MSMFRATGHRNAYFPLFIPLSYFAKEAEHVQGFAKECAVVTHTRLEVDAAGKMKPASPLTEPLVVRPTSETIIGASYAKWVQSYRDLAYPSQSMGQCRAVGNAAAIIFAHDRISLAGRAHCSRDRSGSARGDATYARCLRNVCARSLRHSRFRGEKSESEKFPGAVQTLTIEAIVQDRKAIQAGTSHFLGQNFARASGIQFQNREGKQEFGWTTSWGMTTRMVGTVIMAHGDDDGVILPPRIAPTQIVILPITPKEETQQQVLEACDKLVAELRVKRVCRPRARGRDRSSSIRWRSRNWEWIKKGVPIRLELGPRDLEKNSVAVSRRDQPVKEKQFMPTREFVARAPEILGSIQQNLYQRALKFRDANTRTIESKEEFYDFFTPKDSARPEIHGGFALAHWNGSREIEEKIKSDLKVTIRCIPLTDPEPGRCIFSGQASESE